MKLSLDKTLSLVAISVIGVLGAIPAQASIKEQVYEIVNLEDFDLVGRGTLDGTQRGYGMGVNVNDEVVGVSKGRKKLNDDDVDDGIIDVEDGIAPEEQITYSVNEPILGNNFTFVAKPNNKWLPEFDSIGGETAPNATPANTVDAIYYAINDAGTKVGTVSGEQKTIDYDGDNEDQEFWYYRDFELRGIAKKPDGTEIELLPPYTTYTYKPDTADAKKVNVGGWSVAADINANQLIAGYASTEISKLGAERIDACFADDATLPVDICVQAKQFPDFNGTRGIQYQTRAAIWDLSEAEPQPLILPLGLTPAEDSETVFTAQGLSINADGVVAGRSDTYRKGEDFTRFDAGYWKKEANDAGTEEYAFNPVPFPNSEYYNTIAYDINDGGILVGTYDKVIQGYPRTKFFTLDINAGGSIKTPVDFTGRVSDLSAIPRDINNDGWVVGTVDVTFDKDMPRVKAGFLYDSGTVSGEEAFINLNEQLTCESKGLEPDGDTWKRHDVKVTDGSGKELSYKTEIQVVDATSIAENGTIVGTAFVRKPKYKVDSQGNMVDKDGEPVTNTEDAVFELNGYGQPLTSLVPRAVVLKPSNGEICTYVEPGDNSAPYERKGAAAWAWLILLPLLWLRRRFGEK
ncbi:MAG: DUF3466 family protein [Shewanella sp.]|nr:DUF3466 family protein [Shewanella sp.]